ncbi:hypothetical protein [Streptomyces sp. NPDC087300]
MNERGTAYGSRGFVIGALTGEVVRRATGRSTPPPPAWPPA